MIFLATLFVIVAVLVGGAYYMVTRPSALVVNLPTITPSKGSSAEFDRKLSSFLTDLGASMAFGETQTVTLVVTEEEATSKLAEFVQSGQLGIDILNPQVHFQNDRVQISGDIGAGGIEVGVAVQAKVVSIDGKLEIVLEKVGFGSLGVPELLRKQVLDTITSGTGAMTLEDLPMEIESIRISDGELVIEGSQLP